MTEFFEQDLTILRMAGVSSMSFRPNEGMIGQYLIRPARMSSRPGMATAGRRYRESKAQMGTQEESEDLAMVGKGSGGRPIAGYLTPVEWLAFKYWCSVGCRGAGGPPGQTVL